MKIANDVLFKLVRHLQSHGFLNCVGDELALKQFQFGPAGEFVRETLRKEWIYSNVIHKEYNVFTFTSNEGDDLLPKLRDPFTSAKNLTNSLLPICLAESNSSSGGGCGGPMVPQYFTALHYYAFIVPSEGEQFFYRYQQERKRWWRKFSLDPGKFSFAEVEKKEGDLGQSARIVAEFPWAVHTLESIDYLGAAPFHNMTLDDENIFWARHQKKKCIPHLIKSVVNLDYAAFSYMCDAYTSKKGKVILKFHRKLAPFKFAFAAQAANEDEGRQLFELAELVCLRLKKSGLPALLPIRGDFGKRKLDAQLSKAECLGIPYTILLEPETLHTGIIHLYSRDTTLQEQVHISKMPEYGELLMKNF